MIRGFGLGQGIWEELDREVRIRQLTHVADLIDELYPSVRWYFYDGRAEYAVPVTIFGPKRAALYVGNMYLVFTTTEHIRSEEHTSELQSLLRISYAVFCLKKKTMTDTIYIPKLDRVNHPNPHDVRRHTEPSLQHLSEF